MPFPVTARYFLNFRNSDTGLTPSPVFKRADTFAGVGAPSITEVSNGEYYFDWTWTTSTDVDVTFVIDGGASIPTEEVRYIKGVISPRDRYIDEAISQVKDDVWNDVTNRSVGTKGDFVEHIGVDGDAVNAATVFGQVYKARDVIMGGSGFGGTGVDVKTVSDHVGTSVDAVNATTVFGQVYKARDVLMGGSGFGGTGVDIKTVRDTVPGLSADAVWDEAISGHTTAGTFGQTLQLEDNGAVQGAGSTTVTLRAGASAIDDFYKNGLITITSGTGVGQSRSITGYNGTTKIATVDRSWATNPVSTDGYIILPAAPSSSLTNAGIASAVWDEAISSHMLSGTFGQTLQLLTYGTAQAGASGTITLANTSSGVNDFYNNALLVITSGQGFGQSRTITTYVGASRLATVDRAWVSVPNGTSQYIILPASQAPLDSGSIANAVWDEPLASHLTAGTTGAQLNAAGTGVNFQFYANGDTVKPLLFSVSSPKHTQVQVVYSEPVVMTTGSNGALNLSNYSIAGLTISAISAITSTTVMLTTSPQTPNFLYTLVVVNVEDLSGNVIL